MRIKRGNSNERQGKLIVESLAFKGKVLKSLKFDHWRLDGPGLKLK